MDSEAILASRSSPWRERWSLENWGTAKSKSQGEVVRALMHGDLWWLSARERWLEW